MKKILAMAMALVMMMLVAVPAFATKSFDETFAPADPVVVPDGNQTVVTVDGTNGGAFEGTYTVIIPATIALTWGDTEASDEYKITSQLATDKRVQVTLAKSADLTNGTDTIPFTATDDTDGLSAKEVIPAETPEAHAFKLAIEDKWATVPYDVYEGHITFTASIVDAPAVNP